MGRIYAANRIRELRKAKGLTQDNIADGLGGTTTKATVAKLETRAMALSLDYIVGIARVIGVPPGELIEPQGGGAHKIPLIDLASAGDWREAASVARETVAVPDSLAGDHLFAVLIDDDSVNTIIPKCGMVAVNPDDLELSAGRVYVIANSRNQVMVRRFNAAPMRFESCSTNPAHEAIEIGREPFLTIGRAVWGMIPL